MSRQIDYGNLMHRAMRGLIRTVLEDVAANGLPGTHHFFITFDTAHPDAELADWLSDRYPGEMTVVMQHWYDNLDVGEDGFAVTLNFGDSQNPFIFPTTPSKPLWTPRWNLACGLKTRSRKTRTLLPPKPSPILTRKRKRPGPPLPKRTPMWCRWTASASKRQSLRRNNKAPLAGCQRRFFFAKSDL